MGIEFVRDEADKRRQDPLYVSERAGFHRRWVRTKGYDAEGHMERMKDLGYVAVERSSGVQAPEHPAAKKRGAQLDNTVKRGDLMLMEVPEDVYRRRRVEHQAFTRSRTEAVNKNAKGMGAKDETVVRETVGEEA